MLITLKQLKSALQAVKSYVTRVVPTKTSDLTNDSGFATKNYVDTAVSSVESPPEIFIGSTTPSGYTVYIDPDGMVENAKGVSF